MATEWIENTKRLDYLGGTWSGPYSSVESICSRAVELVSLATLSSIYTRTDSHLSSGPLCQLCQSLCSMLCSPGRVREVRSYWRCFDSHASRISFMDSTNARSS